jgi:hypothetical protein
VPVQLKLVRVAPDKTVEAAVVVDKAISLTPNEIERTPVPVEANNPVCKVNPFRDSAPAVNVVVSVDPIVKVLPKDQPPAALLNVIGAFIDTPLVVIVLPVVEELNVIAPVLDQTVPATKDILPDTARVGVVPVAKVTVPADTVISKQSKAPVIVTVYVPAWSKNTESAAVGTEAPPAPPEVALQLVVRVVFQVPAPPRQYLFAMLNSPCF